jgi:hypothetical protein
MNTDESVFRHLAFICFIRSRFSSPQKPEKAAKSFDRPEIQTLILQRLGLF